MFPTKQEIQARLEALEREEQAQEEEAADELMADLEEGPVEVLAPYRFSFGPGFSLTASLASQGFVVEREGSADDGTVSLETTPSTSEVFREIRWDSGGPTAPDDAVRIVWEDSQLEGILDEAAQSTVYNPPDLPAEPVVVVEGEGWEAVVPADQVVENMIMRRSDAERHDYEPLGPAPSWVGTGGSWDLVEVDAEPIPSDERFNY